MKGSLIAMLCAASLAVGYNAYEPDQPVPQVEAVETVYRASMGCDLPDCTDPAHFHLCAPDCTEACHYHDCPIGCTDPAHPCCGQSRASAAEDGLEWPCPRVDCPAESCPIEDCPRVDCPAESCPIEDCPRVDCPVESCPIEDCPRVDCPVEDCPNICQPYRGGHSRRGQGHHGRWHH